MRKKIVAGNWKMNLELNEGVALATEINKYFNANPLNEKEVALCTPFIHLSMVSRLLDAPGLTAGAQNCNDHKSGAFTGEVSAAMIRSTGAGSVIIGHSERRTYYGETDELLASKTNEALRNGLRVIFCCGEVLAERESGIHFEVVKRQLEKGLFVLSAEDPREAEGREAQDEGPGHNQHEPGAGRHGAASGAVGLALRRQASFTSTASTARICQSARRFRSALTIRPAPPHRTGQSRCLTTGWSTSAPSTA